MYGTPLGIGAMNVANGRRSLASPSLQKRWQNKDGAF